jgi:hypothetical protein
LALRWQRKDAGLLQSEEPPSPYVGSI